MNKNTLLSTAVLAAICTPLYAVAGVKPIEPIMVTIPAGNFEMGHVTEEDAKDLLNQSGADGVMVGRGTYGRPWFLNQVNHYLKTGEKIPDPTLREKYFIIKEHLESILSHYGTESGSKIARKHMAWYSKGLINSAQFRVSVNQTQNAQELTDLIDSFFSDHI